MRDRRKRHTYTNHERWLVSYADFITLLFAFFVVLYASSKADQKKQQQVSQAIDSAFHALGIFPEATRHPNLKNISAISRDEAVTPMNIVMGEDLLAAAQAKQNLETVRKQLEHMLSDQIAQHTVSIQMGKDGLVISLREAGFFSSGSATPQPATLPILNQIANSLGHTNYDLRVEGHTDNAPIHTDEFPSNWELSTTRATRIARVFLSIDDFKPERISVAGYAEYHPVASNETPEGRAENRRVDIIVMPPAKINIGATDAKDNNAGWRKITEH